MIKGSIFSTWRRTWTQAQGMLSFFCILIVILLISFIHTGSAYANTPAPNENPDLNTAVAIAISPDEHLQDIPTSPVTIETHKAPSILSSNVTYNYIVPLDSRTSVTDNKDSGLVTTLVSGVLCIVDDLISGLDSALSPSPMINSASSSDDVVIQNQNKITDQPAEYSSKPSLKRSVKLKANIYHKEIKEMEQKQEVPLQVESDIIFLGGITGGTASAAGMSSQGNNVNGSSFQTCVVSVISNPIQLPLTGSIIETPDPIRLPPFLAIFSPAG